MKKTGTLTSVLFILLLIIFCRADAQTIPDTKILMHDYHHVIAYSGSTVEWTADCCPWHSERLLRPGGGASFSFYGNFIEWHAHGDHNDGMADIYIDGVYQETVDHYNAPGGEPYKIFHGIVYANYGLSPGTHDVRIINIGRKNQNSSGYDVGIRHFVVGTLPPCQGVDIDADGYSLALGDCDENDPNIYPGAVEVCDYIDNNCNGQIDEGFDQDGDGFTTCIDDCNDEDAAIHPLAWELPGNSVDENCDGSLKCDPDDFWRNHGEFVRCVSNEASELVNAGAITETEGDALIDAAAKSDIGKKKSK